jgi:hypothetical protein
MTTLAEVFRAFSSVVSQMPGQNPQRRGTARTLPNFCVVRCTVCFVTYSVLFVCICVLYYCHRVATQLQLNIYIYHIICILALVTRNAMRMRRIILLSAACQCLPHFATLSHKRHDFRERTVLNVKCVRLTYPQLVSETFLIIRIIQRDIIISVPRQSCKVPAILVRL